VRRSHDVVSVDARGTGRSRVVDCRSLQGDARTRSGAGAAACAARLGRRRGAYVVREQVADLEAVRRALRVPRIDLLGTSYGTRVALRYAQAHPARVGRLVLDSVVPPEGPSPVAAEILGAMPRVLGDLCAAARCRRYAGDLTAEVGSLVAALRSAPLRAAIPDGRGRPRRHAIDRVGLLDLLLEGDFSQGLRDALPAAIAGARRGDPAPLLRLHRLAVAASSRPVLRSFSVGAYAAGSCEDLSLPWDPAADPQTRARQAAERLTAQGEGAFAPFDVQTVVDADFLALCRGWPAPRVQADPAAEAAVPLPAAPMLLLSGAEDLRTPVEEARAVAARAPRARLLVVPRVGTP
jgi:pimeloyl-ACP methyl ester carboxylesterase